MKIFVFLIFLFQWSLFAGPNEDLIKNTVTGNIGGVRRALKAGAEANVQVRDLTPLMIASGKGSEEIVNLLLESNADPNVKGDNGKTAFTISMRRNHLKIAEILAAKGTDVNAKDDKGVTSLMWAAYEGREDAVKFLIEKQADVNLANNVDKTALKYAEERNFKSIIKLLKEAGAE
jgi:uncharacterized protein